jgi:DNA-directed RNA polymerase subunit RPC12/RpoP
MLLEKDKYCKCPNCGCKSFKDVSIVNVKVIKDEWNEDFLVASHELNRYKCTRCGKEWSSDDLYNHYSKE